MDAAPGKARGDVIPMYDELIEQLRETSIDFGESDHISVMMIEAADAIEELSNIQIAPEKIIQTMWIPVTERLPNCNGCYLVLRPHFFGGEVGMPSICYFDGSNTWHDSYGVDFERILHPEDITHWMPLPQPPERDGE